MALPSQAKSLSSKVFADGVDKKKIKDTSKRQELDIAAKMNEAKLNTAKRQPLSGADYRAKGDVKSDCFLIEAKFTEKASLGVKASWLEKITLEAMQVGKLPALALRLHSNHAMVEDDWFVVPASLFYSTFGKMESLSNESDDSI